MIYRHTFIPLHIIRRTAHDGRISGADTHGTYVHMYN